MSWRRTGDSADVQVSCVCSLSLMHAQVVGAAIIPNAAEGTLPMIASESPGLQQTHRRLHKKNPTPKIQKKKQDMGKSTRTAATRRCLRFSFSPVNDAHVAFERMGARLNLADGIESTRPRNHSEASPQTTRKDAWWFRCL